MGHDVFISYSTKDVPIQDAVCVALESAGVRCWIAPRDIAAGASYAGEIVRAIPGSRAMVLVFSAAANDSEHVKREVERAVSHEVAVIPFRIEDVKPTGEMEYFISRCQWVDAVRPPLQPNLDKLVRAVQDLLRPPAAVRAPSPAPLVPGRRGLSFRLDVRSVGCAGSLVLCLILAVGFWPMLGKPRAGTGGGPLVSVYPTPAPGSVGQTRMEKRFDLMNSVGVRLVRIEPGEFWMGSPPSEPGRGDDERRHRVRLTRPFFMSIEEVTRGQFAAFVNESKYETDAEREGFAFEWSGKGYATVDGATWKKAGYDQDDSHPVVNVSWCDATAFCDWLAAKGARGAEAEGRYRLPTEAEWEYACRAGTETAYSWGDAPDSGAGRCNAADLTAKAKFPGWATFNFADGFVYTAPTGSFGPNRWGLYDLHGNVLEWCADGYGEYPEPTGPPADVSSPASDPTGPPDRTSKAAGTAEADGTHGIERVLRGGSWGDGPSSCRAAARRHHAPGYRSFETGFRVVWEARTPGRPAPATSPACSRPSTRAMSG